jgi:dephospho-CoA kinase
MKPTILIVGHKNHGKTTLAKMICGVTGLKAEDSSMAALKEVIYPVMENRYGYKTLEECYADKEAHREEWFELIAMYNKGDETRLARKILENNDIYVGMRRTEELEKSREEGIFDYVIGCYNPNKPLESSGSNTVDPLKDSDFVIFTDGSIEDLKKKVTNIFG